MSLKSSQIWLRIGAALLVLVGIILALAAYTATTDLAAVLVNLVQWPVGEFQALVSPEVIRINGTTGGILIGWGLMIWLTVDLLYPQDPRRARAVILISLSGWCVADSVASIVAGVAVNAVCNVLFLLLFAVPLVLAVPSRDTMQSNK